MTKTRSGILLVAVLFLALAVPAVQAQYHDEVTIWVRNLTSYEYSFVAVGPSPYVLADASHTMSSSVHVGPVGRYGFRFERTDGFVFRGDVFVPRNATLMFTITAGPGPQPILTVAVNNMSPFGQSIGSVYDFPAVASTTTTTTTAPESTPTPAPPTPVPSPTPQTLTRDQTYVVQPGDSIPKIAARVGLWPSVVAAMNGVSNGNIWPGQVLQFRNYTVQLGDTFYSVAAKLATTRAQLLAANPGLDTEQLRHGQVLRVP